MSAAVTVRPPRDRETAELARLINAVSQAEYAADDVTEAEIRRWFSQPNFDPARDVFVAEEAGRPIAYADVGVDGDTVEQFWLDVRLPGEASDAAGEALIAAGERRVAERAADSASGAEPRVIAYTSSVNERLARLLEQAGYRLYRHSYRMLIELDGDLAEPAFPEDIEVRGFEPGEARAVFDAIEEAFQDTWDHVPRVFEEWCHWSIAREGFDATLWWLALEGSEIAGVCLCRRHETEPDLGWVSTLGVRRPWRRRGIARALLLLCFREFRRRGFERVGLGVDADSLTGAQLLYESAGMRPERRFDLYDKRLRSS